MGECEEPHKEEFSPESPATKGLVEQGETLHVQDDVLQKGGCIDTAHVAAG